MDIMELWTGADMAFTVILVLSILIMLYAMALMSRAIRLLQYKVSAIENDLKLIDEGLKMIAGREGVDLSKVKPSSSD
jgi:hypothetical protein